MELNTQGRVMDLNAALKFYFGYETFRGTQKEVIENVLNGNSSVVIMPTGAGKSLCYQLPAIITDGMTIVVSPLIALMKNQVDQLKARDISAEFLNSSLPKRVYREVLERIKNNEIKILYLAPETLVKDAFLETLHNTPVSFVAVDEAHCISEWGHDFRPEYREIRKAINKIRSDIPVMALTATATPKVQLDIIKNLEIEDAKIFKSSFNRPNLYYEIRPKIKPEEQIVRYIKEHPNASGIVYCLARKKVEQIAALLQENGIKAAPYHAGLDTATRSKHQDMFLNEDINVVVATIAFGMGIDKPDVRFVIHYDIPKSIESYYQETGRAGRDSKPSDCILFYDYNDLRKLEKFLKDKPLSEREAAQHLLFEMAIFCESAVCRRKQIIHYFGEEFDEKNCQNMCDNCRHPKEKYSAQEFVTLALRTVHLVGERFEMKHLIRILLGKKGSDKIKLHKHDKLEVFGKGTELSEAEWKSVFTQLLIYGFIEKDIEDYGILKLTNKGKKFLEKPHKIELFKIYDYSKEIENSKSKFSFVPKEDFKGYDEVLYSRLIKLRKKIADKLGLPPYVIFLEESIEEMALKYPTSLSELTQIKGVGAGKANKYGKEFVELIAEYVEENEVVKPTLFRMRNSGTKSKLKMNIIKMIDRKISLDEIAEVNQLEFEELLEIIEKIIYAGSKINIDYYIEEELDEEDVEEIWDYFENTETDDLEEALDTLGEYFEEDIIRLVRIKFYSDKAN